MFQQDPSRPFQADIPDEIRNRADSRYTLVICAECQEAMHLEHALAFGSTIVDAPDGTLHGVIDRCARCATADPITARNRHRVLHHIGTVLAGAALVTSAVVLGAIAGLIIVGAVLVLLGRILVESDHA